MSDFTDEWFCWLELDEKWRPKLMESLKNIEIDGKLHSMDWEGQVACLAPVWIEKVAQLEKKMTKLDKKVTKPDGNYSGSLMCCFIDYYANSIFYIRRTKKNITVILSAINKKSYKNTRIQC